MPGNRTRVEASTTPHDNRYTTRAGDFASDNRCGPLVGWVETTMATKNFLLETAREQAQEEALGDMFGTAFGEAETIESTAPPGPHGGPPENPSDAAPPGPPGPPALQRSPPDAAPPRSQVHPALLVVLQNLMQHPRSPGPPGHQPPGSPQRVHLMQHLLVLLVHPVPPAHSLSSREST